VATLSDARDRLQPALLDRLTDAAPGAALEADDHRVMTRAALRRAVVRDLGWMLNAVQPLRESEAAGCALAAHSVVNYGLPALAGMQASKVDVSLVEKSIRNAIVDFEPRLAADSIFVKAVEAEDVLSTHNVIEFEIRALLWAQPVPLELLLRTQLDLESAQVRVEDLSAAATASRVAAVGA
jgi:type VI secretion system protein ImpF